MPAEYPAAVLWDMDGTLIDSERLWDVSLQDTARELGGALRAASRDALVGVDIDTSIVVLLGDVGVPATPERIAWTYERLVARTEELFTAGDVEWRPGARAALRTVRAAGIPTALVTNSLRRITELALDGIGREFFDVTVCGDEVEEGKPAPDPYRAGRGAARGPGRGVRGRRGLPERRAGRRARRRRGPRRAVRGAGADRAAAYVP